MSRFQLERVNVLWFLTLGLTALFAGILVYILLLQTALGAFSITEVAPRLSTKKEAPKVALLNSQYTRDAHMALNPGDTLAAWVDVTLRSWREFLLDKSRNISFSEVLDAQVENGEIGAFDVLILPSSRALSDKQITEIKKFMENGGSVLATWTPGIYQPDGSWRGWSFVEEAFGVSFISFVDRDQGNYRIYQDTFPGITPPGIYRPESQFATDLYEPDSLLSSYELYRVSMRKAAEEAEFGPLSQYRWVDTLGTIPPKADYATADTLTRLIRGTESQFVRQKAVAVNYYTWMGDDSETQTPYPNTGAGIRRFTLRGNSPLTAKIPSGYRMKVQIYNPAVRVRVVEPRAHAAGFWYDYAVEPDRLVQDGLDNTTGLVYGTYGQGRFIYMGMQRDALGVGREDAEDLETLAQFFANIMNYLRHRPIVWVDDWPHPYQGGALLVGLGEAEIENFASVADILAAEGSAGRSVGGTYVVPPDRAPAHRALLQRLHREGEVAVLGEVQRDGDGAEAAQAEYLARLKRALEEVVGGPVYGYRSDDRGMYGWRTMGALRTANYRYFLPDSIGRRMMPKIMGFPFETLTRIGVTARSDQDLLQRLPGQELAYYATLMREDIRRVTYEHSMYNFIYHADMFARPEYVEGIRTVVRALQDDNYWIGTGSQVAHWWRIHKGLNTDVEQRGDSRIIVRISNDNGDVAESMAVRVALGHKASSVDIKSELVNTVLPKWELEEDGMILVLDIRQLKPQQVRIFHIDLLNERGEPILARAN